MHRLRDGEWISGAGALALLAAMFMHWYGVEVLFDGGSPQKLEATAWQAFGVLDVVLAVLALLPFAAIAAQMTRRSPSIPVLLNVLTAVAGVLAVLLILYRIADPPGPNDLVGTEPGAWLGLLAAAVILAGGWRSIRVETDPGRQLPAVQDMPVPAP